MHLKTVILNLAFGSHGVPASLSRAQAAVSDTTMREHYFDLLQNVLDKIDLFNSACKIYHIDETRMPMDPEHAKAVTLRAIAIQLLHRLETSPNTQWWHERLYIMKRVQYDGK